MPINENQDWNEHLRINIGWKMSKKLLIILTPFFILVRNPISLSKFAILRLAFSRWFCMIVLSCKPQWL